MRHSLLMKTTIAVLTCATIMSFAAPAANLSFESDLADWSGVGKYETVSTKLDRQSKAGSKEALISASVSIGAADVSKQEKGETDAYLSKWNALQIGLEPKSISAISQIITVAEASKVQIDVNAYRVAGGKGYGGVSLINTVTGKGTFLSLGQVEVSAANPSSGGWDYELGWTTRTFNIGAGDWELTAGLFSYGDDLPVAIGIDNIRVTSELGGLPAVDEPIGGGKGGAVIGAMTFLLLVAARRHKKP